MNDLRQVMSRFNKGLTTFHAAWLLIALLTAISSTQAGTIVAATGGSAIPADTVGGGYTSLTGPGLREVNGPGSIGIGTLVLNCPAGFEFDSTTPPTVRVTKNGGMTVNGTYVNGANDGQDFAVSSITANAITFDVTIASTNESRVTWQNVRVRPTTGTPGTNGNITLGGTSTVNGAATGSNMGTLTVVAGAVSTANSTFTASALSVEANGTASTVFTVTLRDAVNNLLNGRTVTLSGSPANSSVAAPAASGMTDASGVITFTVTDTVAETVTYTATVTSAPTNVVLTPTPVVEFFGPTSAGSSTVVAAPAAVDANGTTVSTITVTLLDAGGREVVGKTVTLTPDAGASVITTINGMTNAAGRAVFEVTDATPEVVVYTAVGDGVTLTQTATVSFFGTVDTGTSTVIASPTAVDADGTTTSTITVTLRDAGGRAVVGKTVTLDDDSANATITTISGTTNASGVATFEAMNATAESVIFTATGNAVVLTSTATVSFFGAVSAGASTVMAVPASVDADNTTASVITVTLRDAGNRAVVGKTVTLGAASGSSSITTISGTTNASGQATFEVRDAVAEAVTYTATGNLVAITQTAPVTFFGAVSTANSTVAASPTAVDADGTTASTVTVTLRDSGNRNVVGKTVTLTANAGSSAAITTITGTTNASGQATFEVRDATAESVVLTAVGNLITLTQTPTIVFFGPVSVGSSSVVASASAVPADGTTVSTITVTLRDAGNRAVVGKTVTLDDGAATSTITTISGTTNAAGQATFEVSHSTLEAVTYTATGNSVAITQTATVTFYGAVAAANSTVVAVPTSVTADGTSASTITVTLKDTANSNVPGKLVTLAGVPNTSTITTLSGTTNANGEATFEVTHTIAEPVTYTATGDSVVLTQTAAVIFTAGTATQLAINAGNNQTALAGSAVATAPSVRVTDANDNPVAGFDINFAVASGNGTVAPATVTTNAAGIATVTAWTMGAGGGANTLTASGTGLTAVTFAATATLPPFNLTSGPTATPNPALVAQSIQFVCAADLAGTTYTWDFGDGTTDTSGSGTVSHAYAAASAGTGYHVTVTAVNGARQLTGSIDVVVNTTGTGGGGGGGATPPLLPLTVTKKSLRAKVPSANKDAVAVSGSLILPTGTKSLAGPIEVKLGSFTAQFTLSAKGSGKGSGGSFALKGKAKKGLLLTPNVTFQGKFTGNFVAVLENAGLAVGTSGSVKLPFELKIAGVSYGGDVNLMIVGSAKSMKGK